MEHKEVKVWKFGRCYSFSNRCILIFQGVVLDVNLESGDRPFTFPNKQLHVYQFLWFVVFGSWSLSWYDCRILACVYCLPCMSPAILVCDMITDHCWIHDVKPCKCMGALWHKPQSFQHLHLIFMNPGFWTPRFAGPCKDLVFQGLFQRLKVETYVTEE